MRRVEDFDIPLSTMSRSSRKRINKETADLNDTVDQMNLTGVYIYIYIYIYIYTYIHIYTFYPTTAEYMLFSSTHGTFSRIDHTLGHKINLSKFKKIEIILNTFSDHNGMKLEINNKRKTGKFINTWNSSKLSLTTNELKKTIQFMTASKRIKHLGINLTKDVKGL